MRDEFVGKGLRDDTPTPAEIRPAQTASKAPVAKKMPAMRRPVTCPVQANAKSGPPPIALVKQLIQCSWEEMSTERSIINFDLHTVQIGTPRKWETRWNGGDIGNGVPGETVVYPIQGTWTKKIFAVDGSSVIITEEKGTHKCYIDPFHKWKCSYESSTQTQPMQEIYR